MASYPINPFINNYVPLMAWPALLATYGTQVVYLPQGDAAQAVPISVLWKEGRSDEEVSPGRYSHMDVQNAALPSSPAKGDIVQNNGRQYEVVHVGALAIGYSVIVVQETGPVL